MGFRDYQTTLSSAQAITTTAQSTNVLDLGDVGNVIGQMAKQPRLKVVCTVSAAGSATSINIALQDSASAGGSFADTVVKITGIAKAKVVAGAMIVDVPLPRTGGPSQTDQGSFYNSNISPLRRYLAVEYTLTGGAWSAGKFTAWIDVD